MTNQIGPGVDVGIGIAGRRFSDTEVVITFAFGRDAARVSLLERASQQDAVRA